MEVGYIYLSPQHLREAGGHTAHTAPSVLDSFQPLTPLSVTTGLPTAVSPGFTISATLSLPFLGRLYYKPLAALV